MSRPSTFFVGLGGIQHRYETAAYNASRTNERAVEIPIFQDWIMRHPGRLLEMGNVLRHYDPSMAHTVIDRYEHAPGVTNMDILDFEPKPRFDAIVTISTIEHIGWDDTPRDELRALDVIPHLRRMLNDRGRLLVSFPIGHHPHLDTFAALGGHPALDQLLMVRTDNPTERCEGTWEPRSGFEFGPIGSQFPYLHHAWSAGAVWVGEFGPFTPEEETPHGS